MACSLLLVTVKWIIQSESCKKPYVPLQKATFTTVESYAPCQKVQTQNAPRWDNWKSNNTCRCGYHWREVSVVPTASGFKLSQHYELSTESSSQQLNWHNPDKSLVRLVGDYRKWKLRLSSGQTGSEPLSLTWLLTLGWPVPDPPFWLSSTRSHLSMIKICYRYCQYFSNMYKCPY